MLLLNISTVLALAAVSYAAGLVTPAAWWLWRKCKADTPKPSGTISSQEER